MNSIFNKPKVKYMHISNSTKHYKQNVLYHKQKPRLHFSAMYF